MPAQYHQQLKQGAGASWRRDFYRSSIGNFVGFFNPFPEKVFCFGMFHALEFDSPLPGLQF